MGERPEKAAQWVSYIRAERFTSRWSRLAVEERVPFTESGGRRWYRRDHVERLAAARSWERFRGSLLANPGRGDGGWQDVPSGLR